MCMNSQKEHAITEFLRDLGWSGIGIGVALASDFGFYILTGRLLGPKLFGVFGAFMAIFYIAVGPLSHALEMTARKIAAEENTDFSTLIMPALKVGAAFFIIFLAFTPITSRLLSLPMDALITFSLVFPFAYVVAVLVGAIQGQEKFRAYAVYEIFSSGIKFSALGLVILGLGVTGALMAPVMEIIAGLLIALIFIKPSNLSSKFKDYLLLQKSGIFILGVYAAFSIDILFLKIFMSAETVGLYNSIATIGKAVFFGSIAINRAVFPKFVKDPDNGFSLLHLSLLFVALGGTAAAIFFKLLGPEFLTLTFGSEYAAAAGFAPLYMIFITAVSAVSLLGNYHLSFDSHRLEKVLLLPILQTIGILLFHESVFQILYVSIGSAVFTVLLLYLPLYLDRKIAKDIYHTIL